MKFLKWLLVIIGVVGLAVGAFYLFKTWVDLRALMYAANANKSQGFPNPISFVYLATGLASAGGLVLGLGLGLPRRTASSIRKEAMAALAPVQAPQGLVQAEAASTSESEVDEQVAQEARPQEATKAEEPSIEPEGTPSKH